MPFLIVRRPDHVDRVVELRDGFTIGRDDDNDLVLADRQASRRHARIAGGVITDLGSTHGTLIDGVAVVEPRALADGIMDVSTH